VALILWMMVQPIEEQPRPHMIHHHPKHKTAAEDQLSPPSVLAYLELSPRCASNITDQGQPATKVFVSRSLFHRANWSRIGLTTLSRHMPYAGGVTFFLSLTAPTASSSLASRTCIGCSGIVYTPGVQGSGRLVARTRSRSRRRTKTHRRTRP
jgi:hypothetical protein